MAGIEHMSSLFTILTELSQFPACGRNGIHIKEDEPMKMRKPQEERQVYLSDSWKIFFCIFYILLLIV